MMCSSKLITSNYFVDDLYESSWFDLYYGGDCFVVCVHHGPKQVRNDKENTLLFNVSPIEKQLSCVPFLFPEMMVSTCFQKMSIPNVVMTWVTSF